MSKPNLLVARTATDGTTDDTTDGSAAKPNITADGTEDASDADSFFRGIAAGLLDGVAALLLATIALSGAPSMRCTMSARRLLN